MKLYSKIFRKKDNVVLTDKTYQKSKIVNKCFVTLSRMRKLHMYFVMLPVNLNFDEHIATYPPQEHKFKSKAKFNIDNAKVILGSLTTVIASNKDLIEDDGYVPLNSTFLNGFITDYNHYLNYFIVTGVIECNNTYRSGTEFYEGYSRKYRWSEQYKNENFERVWLDKALNKKGELVEVPDIHSANSLTLDKASTPKEQTHEYLNYWYEQRKLQISDINLALKYAEAIRDQKLALGKEHWDNNTANSRKGKKDPKEQYRAILHNLHSLEIHDYKVHIDDNVHRLHSVLTNMQKEYRNFIKYDNQPLVSIDISNSQPYLLCLLLNKNFWLGNTFINIANLPYNLQLQTPQSLPIMLGNLTDNLLDNNNTKEYIKNVSEGNFYEYMQQKIRVELGEELSRKDVKTMMFMVFFSKNRFYDQPDARLKRLFAEIYPQIYTVIKALKEKDHSYLACLLQTIESEIVLHRCCKRIYEEAEQETPFFTILE